MPRHFRWYNKVFKQPTSTLLILLCCLTVAIALLIAFSRKNNNSSAQSPGLWSKFKKLIKQDSHSLNPVKYEYIDQVISSLLVWIKISKHSYVARNMRMKKMSLHGLLENEDTTKMLAIMTAKFSYRRIDTDVAELHWMQFTFWLCVSAQRVFMWEWMSVYIVVHCAIVRRFSLFCFYWSCMRSQR